MSNKCLPPSLKGKKHDDWFWPLSYVPRGWTAKCGWAWPQPPVRIWGSSGWKESDWPDIEIGGETYYFGHHTPEYFKSIRKISPIARPGHLFVSAVLFLKFIPLPMLAWTFKNGSYVSLGIVRWDDVDKYYDLLRVRAHGLKGKIALAFMFLILAALVYFIYFIIY